MEIKVTLPRPPSLNHYWRFTSKPFPHWYISAGGKKYRAEATPLLKKAMGTKPPITEELAVSLDLYYCRHVDLDNILKCQLDILKYAEVIKDDRQVSTLALCRHKVPTMKQERVELSLVTF